MRSDTNLVKLFGIIGAMFVLLSLFMNVVTLDIRLGYTDEVLIESDLDPEADEINTYMRYGFTAWELGTVAENFVDTYMWDAGDRKENKEALEYFDESEFEEMYALIGLEIKDGTMCELVTFLNYIVSSYTLYKVLPWIIIVVSITMLAATVFSKGVVKIIMSVMMLACLILEILPAKDFFNVMGVGVVIMMIGIVMSIISTIGSFASSGVVYVEE